jgi:REP element-mobilizing transposase RayT
MGYDDLRKGRFSESGRAYFVTTVLNQRDKRYFSDFVCARLVIGNFKRLHDEQAVNSIAWVVMPDHVHWLFQLGSTATLSAVMKLFKARSARQVNDYLGNNQSLWQKSFYDHGLRSEEDLKGIARYIVANPLRAGLVEHIGEYSHWDAIWL